MTTRHYQHPGRPIQHPNITIRTVYGSATPFLQVEAHPQHLNELEKRYNLKRVYPLGWRTF